MSRIKLCKDANLTDQNINNQCSCGFYFSECSAGVFGKDCVENCSMTCGDPGVCDKVTGHCNGSCLPGWEGNMCQNGNNLYTSAFILNSHITY